MSIGRFSSTVWVPLLTKAVRGKAMFWLGTPHQLRHAPTAYGYLATPRTLTQITINTAR